MLQYKNVLRRHSWQTGIQFLVFAIPLTFILFVVLGAHYRLHAKMERNAHETSDLLNVDLAKRAIVRTLQDIISDLRFLAEYNETQDSFVRFNAETNAQLARQFLLFTKNKCLYDQVRFIDTNGKEIVRVDFNSGNPAITSPAQLQDKAERYYFDKILKLPRDGIYWSPFDLNIENGKIEQPPKPTIRIGTPVFDSFGRKTGILLLNYLGAELIKEFKRAAANIAGHIMLLNACMGADITEHKKLQQQMEERNLEIAKNRELAAVGRMANMIAHDLRNPLSSIKMGLQILRRQASPCLKEQEKELMQIAWGQVRYMEEILSDVLSYSRPEDLKPEWLNIDKLLELAISTNQKEIDERNVRVNTDYQSGLPTLHGDSTRLRQVFSNLILNAAQAAEGIKDRAPEIVVSACLELSGEGPKMQVSITDNGRGIGSEKADKLFEPFYTTRAKGTGLGLPIVKRIVEQHHGTVRLEAADGGGTRALVCLPISMINVQ